MNKLGEKKKEEEEIDNHRKHETRSCKSEFMGTFAPINNPSPQRKKEALAH